MLQMGRLSGASQNEQMLASASANLTQLFPAILSSCPDRLINCWYAVARDEQSVTWRCRGAVPLRRLDMNCMVLRVGCKFSLRNRVTASFSNIKKGVRWRVYFFEVLDPDPKNWNPKSV
jgi:hypothetical protein